MEVKNLSCNHIVLKIEFTGSKVELDELPDTEESERMNESYEFRVENVLNSIYETAALIRGSENPEKLQDGVDRTTELVNDTTSFDGKSVAQKS